jgi:hypothetical protein
VFIVMYVGLIILILPFKLSYVFYILKIGNVSWNDMKQICISMLLK